MTNGNEYVRLLSEAQSGNEESVAELAVLAQDPLYAFIYRGTADHDCAEDLLQETLLVIVQRLRSLRQPGSFWPWVHQIAWSKMQQHFRDRRRQRVLEASARQRYQREQEQAANEAPLESMARQESIESLFTALGQMNLRSRRVLYLRCFQGLPYDQIASLVRSTPNEVRVRLCRAKKCLSRMIAS